MKNPHSTVNAGAEEAYALLVLGTDEVYQELCPDPHAETLKVPVDGDWADGKEPRQSCSGGAVLFCVCAVLTWARTQKTRALSSAGGELYGIGSRAFEGLGAAQLLREWKCQVTPPLQTDLQSALAACKRRGPGGLQHVELMMRAGQEWLKFGRLQIYKVSARDLTKRVTNLGQSAHESSSADGFRNGGDSRWRGQFVVASGADQGGRSYDCETQEENLTHGEATVGGMWKWMKKGAEMMRNKEIRKGMQRVQLTDQGGIVSNKAIQDRTTQESLGGHDQRAGSTMNLFV